MGFFFCRPLRCCRLCIRPIGPPIARFQGICAGSAARTRRHSSGLRGGRGHSQSPKPGHLEAIRGSGTGGRERGRECGRLDLYSPPSSWRAGCFLTLFSHTHPSDGAVSNTRPHTHTSDRANQTHTRTCAHEHTSDQAVSGTHTQTQTNDRAVSHTHTHTPVMECIKHRCTHTRALTQGHR